MKEFYAKSHEWARKEGSLFVCGISDFAQNKIGDVVYIEFPEVGESFTAGDQFGAVESVKSANDIYAPISGEIVEINEELEDSPELVNQSALGEGWICKIKPLSDDTSHLMDKESYDASVLEED